MINQPGKKETKQHKEKIIALIEVPSGPWQNCTFPTKTFLGQEDYKMSLQWWIHHQGLESLEPSNIASTLAGLRLEKIIIEANIIEHAKSLSKRDDKDQDYQNLQKQINFLQIYSGWQELEFCNLNELYYHFSEIWHQQHLFWVDRDSVFPFEKFIEYSKSKPGLQNINWQSFQIYKNSFTEFQEAIIGHPNSQVTVISRNTIDSAEQWIKKRSVPAKINEMMRSNPKFTSIEFKDQLSLNSILEELDETMPEASKPINRFQCMYNDRSLSRLIEVLKIYFVVPSKPIKVSLKLEAKSNFILSKVIEAWPNLSCLASSPSNFDNAADITITDIDPKSKNGYGGFIVFQNPRQTNLTLAKFPFINELEYGFAARELVVLLNQIIPSIVPKNATPKAPPTSPGKR